MNLVKFCNDVAKNGGASYNIATGLTPKTGYMVSLSGHEQVHDYKRDDLELIVKNYVAVKGLKLENPNVYLGAWLNGEKIYLDISTNINDLNEATEFGRMHKQLAIHDVKNECEIKL